MTDPQGNTSLYEGSPAEILIEHPQLWWPHGYGEQPLYTVKLTTFSNGRELDSWQRRIGLRTMTIAREKDEHGESFAHQVNGVKIFAMGADYIPEDNILSRVTPGAYPQAAGAVRGGQLQLRPGVGRRLLSQRRVL